MLWVTAACESTCTKLEGELLVVPLFYPHVIPCPTLIFAAVPKP